MAGEKTSPGIVSWPGFMLFWTSYDPLDIAGGSIDPLGFARGYLALADMWLPGLTTVTTVPRYASMLCAAVEAAEAAVPYTGGNVPQKVRQERLRHVKSYERAWALACGLASRNEAPGRVATEGLRGISYVRRRLETLSPREKFVQTDSFQMLANQVRYGAVGIYSTFLEDCHLATMTALTLRPLGRQLARAFPQPDSGLKPAIDDARLSLQSLFEWGTRAHCADFTEAEGTVLLQALAGADEAEPADHVRWTSLRMLSRMDREAITSEGELLRAVEKTLAEDGFSGLNAPAPIVAQIGAVLRLIEPFERLFQHLTYLFESIVGAATDQHEARIAELGATLSAVCEETRRRVAELQRTMESVREADPDVGRKFSEVVRDSGLTELQRDLTETRQPEALLRRVVKRHLDVQAQKYDRGTPKAPWVRLNPSGEAVRLTAQRHQIPASKRSGAPEEIVRHPYRASSAFAFIDACRKAKRGMP